MDLPKFYTNKDFTSIKHKLKSYICPFCRKRGFLILHGFLQSYDIITGLIIKKAHRIYCSNRSKRKGCGHTWSIYLDRYIPGFSIAITTLTTILLASENIFKGWKVYKATISISSFYRIRDRFNRQILTIRTILTDRFKPPITTEEPIQQTIKHLCSIHKNLIEAITIFQLTFQVSILG